MERRIFVKFAGLSLGAFSLPLQAISSSLSLPAFAKLKPSKEFSIAKLAELLAGYDYPDGHSFDPSSFKLDFQSYSTLGSRKQGGLSLVRRTGASSIEYRFSNKRDIPCGFSYQVSGQVKAAKGALPGVVSWEGTSCTKQENCDFPWLQSNRAIKGRVQGNHFFVEETGRVKTIVSGGKTLSWKWGLIDMVQQMAAKEIQFFESSVLDELDTVYPLQKLQFRMEQVLKADDGATVSFKLYDLTGTGVIPTVYWVDCHNRVVFVISGAEVYLLTTSS